MISSVIVSIGTRPCLPLVYLLSTVSPDLHKLWLGVYFNDTNDKNIVPALRNEQLCTLGVSSVNYFVKTSYNLQINPTP